MNHPSHVICVYLWKLCIGAAGNTEEEVGYLKYGTEFKEILII